jgi:putative PIN family toxin of toxin-antitoxin system
MHTHTCIHTYTHHYGENQATLTERFAQSTASFDGRPLASTATVQELVRVLAYPKFRLSQAEQDELLADYLPYAETVRIPKSPPTVPDCRDVLDLPFMHLAVAGKAQVLVSGDHDLLAIAAEFERVSSCPIVPLDVFCQTYCAD